MARARVASIRRLGRAGNPLCRRPCNLPPALQVFTASAGAAVAAGTAQAVVPAAVAGLVRAVAHEIWVRKCNPPQSCSLACAYLLGNRHRRAPKRVARITEAAIVQRLRPKTRAGRATTAEPVPRRNCKPNSGETRRPARQSRTEADRTHPSWSSTVRARRGDFRRGRDH